MFSCNSNTHKKAKKVAPTEPDGKDTGDKMQKLFTDFKSLDRRQVKDMEDEEALECYCKIKSEDLDWKTAVESAVFNNIRSVCERHGSKIKKFSASKKKRIRRKSQGTTFTSIPAPEQRSRPMIVNTEGDTGATFVSNISSEAGLGNVVNKANTTIFNATQLVIHLTTSTSVSALITDVIITSKANKLHGTTANDLLDQLRAVHKGMEMEANELVLTYMGDDEKKRQVASDVEIDFPEGTPTTLTIEQHILSKPTLPLPTRIATEVHQSQLLGWWVFSEPDTNQKILGSQLQ